MCATVFVNIGSNAGDSIANIEKAISEIKKFFEIIKISSVVESEPWGFDSTSLFLNIGLSFRSIKKPDEILTILQNIEKSISPYPHRNENGCYIDREIDIDIVAIDNLIINEDNLKVPHPYLPQRIFFLGPMEEIAPEWRHPVSGLNAEEMICRLKG